MLPAPAPEVLFVVVPDMPAPLPPVMSEPDVVELVPPVMPEPGGMVLDEPMPGAGDVVEPVVLLVLGVVVLVLGVVVVVVVEDGVVVPKPVLSPAPVVLSRLRFTLQPVTATTTAKVTADTQRTLRNFFITGLLLDPARAESIFVCGWMGRGNGTVGRVKAECSLSGAPLQRTYAGSGLHPRLFCGMQA
jgi:hypothetical protein